MLGFGSVTVRVSGKSVLFETELIQEAAREVASSSTGLDFRADRSVPSAMGWD